MSSLTAILVGGTISLVSAAVGILLQHFLGIRRLIHESRIHPSRVLYDKQIEFLDAIAQLLDQINGYITAIDVWLGERGEKAKTEVQKATSNTACLSELDRLLQKYEMYLPSELLDKLNTLRWECWSLSSKPDLDVTFRSINLLFEIKNLFRELVGVDKLSEDLMKAIGRRPQRGHKEIDQKES
jgi:hypothetical protein